MANISSAEGTITLKGNWTQQAIDAFKPVLNSWEFYGEYGIQDCRNELPLKNKITEFYGCGRWSFSGTLNSFDDWTRDWIKKNPDENHPLTAEQYNEFLKIMFDNDLKIEITFEDEEEGFGFRVSETGVFTSDGENLCYETIRCEEEDYDFEEDSWESLGCESFDAAARFFAQFLVNPDKKELQKWVKECVLPDECYVYAEEETDVYEFLEDNFTDYCFVVDTDRMYDFMKRFKINPVSEWSNLVDFVNQYYCSYSENDLEEYIPINLESDEEFDKWYQKLQNQ